MQRVGAAWIVLAAVAVAGCGFNPSGLASSSDGGADASADDAAVDADPDAMAPDARDPDAAIDATDGDAAVDAPDIDAPIDAATPDAPIDAPIDGPDIDAPTTTARQLVDDTAADFGQGTPTHVETRVEIAGAVAPRAYYMGSLCAGGANTQLFTDGGAATGAVLPATPTKIGLARTVDLNLPNGAAPGGVGITSGTTWTLWWYGEIYLSAGAHMFSLSGDDHAFLELAPIGSTTFTKLLGVDNGTVQAPFTAPTDGWYGFRVALAQNNNAVDLYPQLDGQTIPRWLTRCRVDELAGLALTGFDESQFLDVGATSLESNTPANVNWGFGQPADLDITSADTFSVRWAGQFFIAVGGTYRLGIGSDDGYRLFVDGAAVAIDLGDADHNATTGDLVLAPGWHDVVYDTTETGLGARSQLTVAAGPELVGMAFPPGRLRPAEGRFERFESSRTGAIGNDATGLYTFAPAPGATVSGVDVGFRTNLGGSASSTIVTGLRTTGASTQLQSGTLFNFTTQRFHPTAFAAIAFAATWGLSFSSSNGGALSESWLTVRYRDDNDGPTPTAGRYESSVRDLLGPGGTAVTSLGAATLVVRAATGATVTIAVRTCDSAGACAAAPWSAEFASGAPLVGVTPRRFLQYRLTFTTDGDHEPAVERVQLDYATM